MVQSVIPGCFVLTRKGRIAHMTFLRSWFRVARYIGWYALFKCRLAKPPRRDRYLDAIQYVCGIFTHWNRYIRLRNEEFVPQDHAAIYVGSHTKFGDPFYLFRAAYLASEGRVAINAMSRDDYFVGTPLKTRFVDMDDFITYIGVYGINRDKPTLSQMKTFVGMLKDGTSFILFPGRTRSRSGMLMEYRDNFQEPGGVSFFLNMVHRRDPEGKYGAAIAMRNYNPARDHTSVVFGPVQYLKDGATKDEQRDFDCQLVETMSQYVEVCVPQIVAAILYARCLHGMIDPIAVPELQRAVARVMDETTHPYLDEEDAEDVDEAVRLALAYFRKHKTLEIRGESVYPDAEQILSTPELTGKYKKMNPVKYLTNQILHLGDLVELIQVEARNIPGE
jgi:1-acyl-sn-glycerol-3-phosphate acyltransferase